MGARHAAPRTGERQTFFTVAADLTRAGYGPAPAKTLRWTTFWHAWYHLQVTQARERLEAQTWQLYAAILPHAGKEASNILAELEQQQAAALTALKAGLYAQLPWSARALVGPLDLSASALQSETDWLRAEIAAAPPGRRPFLEAALREALARQGPPSA